ncbi:WD domain G-beta repeat protein [Theileria parva strain Muguga]|uniref:methylated diphthine methylhydrolase n=1 Tax=Theileria parva TaxID=5875 RepID=Q4N5V8_THEPA|nr:WD domain G-beta repeat protein [Theileria parva strain Muguga]EAN32465.1 WD domain G-beta repeat protein [Theileria parva strain Muguga]|eukprot:XP_764748.1 hypothetical protein [Theileria parva strain Muguga]
MAECKSIAQFNLESQPDCIRVFPFENPSDSILSGSFVVGCYRYDELRNHREGCLLFFNPSNYLNHLLSGFSFPKKPELYYFGHDIGGILSCYWTKFDQGYAISCISTKCILAQYSIKSSNPNSSESDGHKFEISKINEIKLTGDPHTIPLSLSTFDDHGSSMCVTCDTGHCYVVRNSEVINWRACKFQTWTSSFHPENSNLILTGSDDSKVRLFDLRSGFDQIDSFSCHESGVTTIQFLPQSTNLFYTGGFDKVLVKYDFRKLVTHVESLKTTTPIWYLDFITYKNGTLESLHVSGCHDGSALYNTSGELISTFKPPNCLIYSTSHVKLSSTLLTSCDFYNKSLHFYL